MYQCYLHNIHLIYLPPHCSHVLQPLDLGVFSSVKAAYRAGINDLNLLTDTSPLGKRQFLRTYCTARETSLSDRNIRAGWRAGGLWPPNPTKPLMSRLLLKPAPPVGTPASQPARRQASRKAVEIKTPSRSQEVNKLVYDNQLGASHTVRQLFQKVGRRLDLNAIELATHQVRIKALENKVEELRPRKRAKVAKEDPNDLFCRIPEILDTKARLAKEAIVLEAKQAEWTKKLEAEGLKEPPPFKSMCSEFSIFT
jgi:hypothetical protein